MAEGSIRIRGASVHNLRQVDVDLPKGRIVAVTGVSGSGKSSLAYDTLFAEGQRRFLESLSPSARQFLHQLPRPKIKRIDGLTPTLAIAQNRLAPNPRATVATLTDIYDHLRLLWTHLGTPWCPSCGIPVRRDTVETIAEWIGRYPAGTRFNVMATYARKHTGEVLPLLEQLHKQGFVRVFWGDRNVEIRELLRDPPRRKRTGRDIDVVVDRLVVRRNGTPRLADALETASRIAAGRVKLAVLNDKDTWLVKSFTAALVCTECGHVCAPPGPRLFSFNAPEGACPTCKGLGWHEDFAPDKLIGDPLCFVAETLPALATLVGLPSDGLEEPTGSWPFERRSTRWNEVPHPLLERLMDGDPASGFPGVVELARRRREKTRSKAVIKRLDALRGERPCPDCNGERLNRDAAAVRVAGTRLPDLLAMDVADARGWIDGLALGASEREKVGEVIDEIASRLAFLDRIRLDYLTLDRPAHTLSGGETQRARLTTQLGSRLEGVTYILDEPTTGLHQADTGLLVDLLRELETGGNTVVVVEHDEQVMRAADHLVELGPGAGNAGGTVVWSGPRDELDHAAGLTAAFLRGEKRVTPYRIRKPAIDFIEVREARLHNLQRVHARFPVGCMNVVTGLSGAGKSTLVKDCLLAGIAAHHHRRAVQPGSGAVLGAGKVDRAVMIENRSLGRGPRSTPVTYIKAMDDIRALYAALPEARLRGFKADRFSFNNKRGQCPQCEGQGVTRVAMHFMPDVFVTCERCHGLRYNPETLAVSYRNRSIGQVLQLSVDEALGHFVAIDAICAKLRHLKDLGLGYLQLGQASQDLSGGEAQRIRLAAELGRPASARCLYVMDEPTSGLHPFDVDILLRVLKRLVERGHTLVIIEHQLDLIAAADWVIDVGPGAGAAGGRIVASGTPEQVAACEGTPTGAYLREHLARTDS